MKNFKTYSLKTSLSIMLFALIFTSCSKEEVMPVEDIKMTNNVVEISRDAIINYQIEAELNKDSTIKEIQQQLNLDDEFVELYAITVDYSLLPLLLNPDMEKSELIQNSETENLAKLYQMNEEEFSAFVGQIAVKYDSFFEKMKAQEISPEKLEQAINGLETSDEFQDKVQSKGIASCLGVCITGGFACAVVQNVGATMRKFASCMGMPLGSTRRRLCIAGVITEQVGHTIVCLAGTAGCIYGCEATRDGFNISDAERLSQGHKDTTISRMYNAAKPHNRPNVGRMQRKWSDGFYYGHNNG